MSVYKVFRPADREMSRLSAVVHCILTDACKMKAVKITFNYLFFFLLFYYNIYGKARNKLTHTTINIYMVIYLEMATVLDFESPHVIYKLHSYACGYSYVKCNYGIYIVGEHKEAISTRSKNN